MKKGQHTTASGEDYLEAVLILQQKNGYVRSIDVARHLGVSKPSVSNAVTLLRKSGLLTMDGSYYLHLTPIGFEIAKKIYERHCFFKELLISVGVDPAVAEYDACQMEHAISAESFDKLKKVNVEKK